MTNITRTLLEPYYWNTSGFSWSDPGYSHKSWGELAKMDFQVEDQRSLQVSEGRGSDMSQEFSTNLGVAETENHRGFIKSSSEDIGVAETYVDLINFLQAVMENLTITDRRSSGLTKALSDNLEISDARAAEFTKGLHDFLNVFDVMSRTVVFERVYQEAVNLVEQDPRHVEKRSSSVFSVLERYIRNANAVVNDIIIDDVPMTLADFEARMQRHAPPGFTPWKMFQPGDHEFDDAIIRIVPRKSDINQELQLTKCTVNVDVPDIQERGRDTIPAGGTWVYFDRTFTDVPENPQVTATLKAGTELAIPRITEIYFDRFFVVCERASDGTSVEVDITWTATGY